MALLHGLGGRLTNLCGCFRPGQLGRDIHDTAGRPHYMKDGHGCLIDGEFMVLAGGFQCPDEHVATSPCSNLALAYASPGVIVPDNDYSTPRGVNYASAGVVVPDFSAKREQADS